MPTTIEDIKEFLDDKDIRYLFDPEKEVFVINFSPNVILIRLEENGEFLQFRTLNFHQYKEGQYKEQILNLISSINYRRKLVKFGYDPEDGEINGCVDMPIEDAEFTSAQFFRCLSALLEALEEGRDRIWHLIEHGKDPGPPTTSAIDTLIEEIMESLDEEQLDQFAEDSIEPFSEEQLESLNEDFNESEEEDNF